MFFRTQLAWCLLFVATAVHAEVNFSPQTGIVLLRNGNMMEGEVTLAGDYYIITQGVASEIRLPKEQVEGVCRDLAEAYILRLATMHGTGMRAQLDMAEWCLRNGILDKAEAHLVEAEVLEPKNPLLPLLKNRLSFAREGSQESTPAVTSSSNVLASDLDHVEDTIPAGAVEKFTMVVQPLLINRCAAGGCHGSHSTSALQIIRPLAGQLVQRRATQRNLLTALKYIDRDNPLQSPLLSVPLGPHANGKPVFDHSSKEQVGALAAWIEQVLQTPATTAPATVQPAVTHLDASGDSPGSTEKGAAGEARSSVNANHLPLGGIEEATTAAKPANVPFRPRDPFDPEIFNRRFQDKGNVATKEQATSKK